MKDSLPKVLPSDTESLIQYLELTYKPPTAKQLMLLSENELRMMGAEQMLITQLRHRWESEQKELHGEN